MKQAHSFLLGGLTSALIIACSGSSDSSQPIKLDSAQVSQIVSAIKSPKWEYNYTTTTNLKKWGAEGWDMVGFDKGPKGNTMYIMKRRVD
ncbi:uncharacterized protein METZ01_LOCUS459276 [marine metagenome]|jgi:hypothetical protein|uniref:DUF4177 domain-containing protein n=1 Tax=marine metagenome TaxID=408172 RepID=A0A383AFD0_9ZZZZ